MNTIQAETRHRVGAVGDFAPGDFRIVDIEGRSVGVLLSDRGFYAVLNSCPHQGAEICRGGRVTGTMIASNPQEYTYSDDKLVLVCPWHRWEFELETGASFGGVTRKRLLTFEVEVENDDVYVKAPPRRGAR